MVIVKYLLPVLLLLLLLPPVSADYPSEIHYEYNWFSYWCGSTQLDAFFSAGSVSISYKILRDSEACGIKPFEEEFDLVIDNLYTDVSELFHNSIDSDELKLWTTTYDNREIAICDGGGYSKLMTLHYNMDTIVVEP